MYSWSALRCRCGIRHVSHLVPTSLQPPTAGTIHLLSNQHIRLVLFWVRQRVQFTESGALVLTHDIENVKRGNGEAESTRATNRQNELRVDHTTDVTPPTAHHTKGTIITQTQPTIISYYPLYATSRTSPPLFPLPTGVHFALLNSLHAWFVCGLSPCDRASA